MAKCSRDELSVVVPVGAVMDRETHEVQVRWVLGDDDAFVRGMKPLVALGDAAMAWMKATKKAAAGGAAATLDESSGKDSR